MKEIAAKGAEIRRTLVDDIERDSESFTLYMKALRMPKDTEEQKAVRREAMQNGLKEAAQGSALCGQDGSRDFSAGGGSDCKGEYECGDRRSGGCHDGPHSRDRRAV